MRYIRAYQKTCPSHPLDLMSPFLAIALACESRLNAFPVARLQIEGASFDFFNYVFLKYLALEASKRAF